MERLHAALDLMGYRKTGPAIQPWVKIIGYSMISFDELTMEWTQWGLDEEGENTELMMVDMSQMENPNTFSDVEQMMDLLKSTEAGSHRVGTAVEGFRYYVPPIGIYGKEAVATFVPKSKAFLWHGV
jgi:hypothetical protein